MMKVDYLYEMTSNSSIIRERTIIITGADHLMFTARFIEDSHNTWHLPHTDINTKKSYWNAKEIGSIDTHPELFL